MLKTKKQIIEDIKLIDIVIELLDARIPISSQNPDIAQITKGKKKLRNGSVKEQSQRGVTIWRFWCLLSH